MAIASPGGSDFKDIKKTIDEFGASLLAVLIHCDPGALPPPYKIVQYIRSQGKKGPHGWGDRVCFVMLPCDNKQQEDERLALTLTPSRSPSSASHMAVGRWLCQREAANQQAFLLTGDVFYHAMEDKSELEFAPLERYFHCLLYTSPSPRDS